ncbi:phosphatidylserine decarboxylase [Streptomyces luteireticuli]|uniref:Phosphatidylserine decarboxylase n=1 Tax=Streptomyces luteireticuli TaxID=173858 RepID=A0ABP3IAF6_9ACTN
MLNGDEEQYSQNLDEFLKKITLWYENDYEGFKTMYDAAVENVVPYPADTPEEVRCDWKGKDIQFLCDFFAEWYHWRSGVNNGLDYIEKFSWINYENDYGMVFVTSGPGFKMTADFTHLQGLQMDDEGPDGQKLIEKWVKELGPKRMADFEPGPWPTFNKFFTRELKDGARPIAPQDEDDSVVVAPADCVINMIVDELTETTPIPVKTVTMNVRQLLGDSDYAEAFIGGTAVSCILMPDTYHWYHSPVKGQVVEAREDLRGVYYGMRDFPELLNKGNVGYGYDYEMFDNFRRGYLVIKTWYPDAEGKNSEVGFVGMVPVGLNSIASVNFLEKFQGLAPGLTMPVPVEKGEKIGNFMYGGSLNILLFEPGRFPALQLLQGQRIGVLEQPERTAGLFTGSYHTQSRRRRPLAP